MKRIPGGVSMHMCHIKSLVKNKLETHWTKGRILLMYFAQPISPCQLNSAAGPYITKLLSLSFFFATQRYTPSVSGFSCVFHVRNVWWGMD